MSEPASDPRRLDAAQARRLLGTLSLRPGERILCLGAEGGAMPGVAAILVGPTGRIVEVDPSATLAEGGTLPYPDGEFDAVILEMSASQSDQADILAEVARVTSPSGRVAVAIPRPAGGDSAAVQQLAEAAGLRGVAVRSDPEPDSGSQPVEFVTAFPPRPASAADGDITTEIHLPKPAGQLTQQVHPAQSRRPGRLLVATASAVVLAAAAGVAWGLAGTDSGDDPPGDTSDLLAGDTELDAGQPGTGGQPAADDPPAGGGLPSDDSGLDSESAADAGSGSSSGSGTSSGSGSGSGDGGEPENQPPEIDDMGLSSNGLFLHVKPTITDPDGDDVSMTVNVTGREIGPLFAGQEIAHRFSFDEVGYEHEASVAVTATDSRGASSRQTASHTLHAKTTATVRNLRLRIRNPEVCFAASSTHQLVAELVLDRTVVGPYSRNLELEQDRPEVLLVRSATNTVVVASSSQSVHLDFAFDGRPGTYEKVHSVSDQVARNLKVGGDCDLFLFYEVEIDRR